MTEPTPSHADSPLFHPPQFRLKSLFWLVTALAVLSAVVAAIGMAAGAMLILLLLLIVGHVAGNAIGTARRTSGAEQPLPEQALRPRPRLRKSQRSQLYQKRPLGRGLLLLALAAAIASGTATAALLAFGSIKPVSAGAVFLAAGSAAAIGAIATLIISCFVLMLHLAWREAARECQQETQRRRRNT